MTTKLYFATNRNHEGTNRWKPTGYGKKFSADGRHNLRFGELQVNISESQVNKYLTKKFKDNRTGDGEGLSDYLSKKAKYADITAYEDKTYDSTKKVEFKDNSSTRFFKNLKGQMMKNTDMLIYIHGYSVSWNQAVGTALSLQHMLNRNRKDGEKEIMVVLFSWPSDGSKKPYVAYRSDRDDASDSGEAVARAILKLQYFLAQLRKDSKEEGMELCFQDMHLLCHSMGNYVLENSLKKIADFSSSNYISQNAKNEISRYPIGNKMPRIFENIFMCSPDVDDDCLEEGKGMGDLHQLANHVSVYHNKGDVAMYLSDYTKGNPDRLGNSGAAKPQLIHNKIHQVNCSKAVKGFVEHSYYMWATVNDDIALTINEVAYDDETRHRKRLANSREWEIV